MSRSSRIIGALLPVGLVLGGTVALTPALLPGTAVGASADTIVEEAPATGTPHVLDGSVRVVLRVGDRIVVGGEFTEVREFGRSLVLKRKNLFAFDPATGEIDESFVPNPDAIVHALEPAANGQGVYVGGEFTRIGGGEHPRLALVQLADGGVVPGFDAGRSGKVAGKVKDLALHDGRLWVAGAFTHIDGQPQGQLATVDPVTGTYLPFMSLAVTGQHNGGFTTVSNIDVSGNRLLASGNFRRVDGKRRQQLVMLSTGGAQAAVTRFRTRFFEARCRPLWNSYVEGVDFSPDGSFFVVATTGGDRLDLGPCDATMRFEARATGRNVKYSWLDMTGGDSSYSVTTTNSVVYVGGHARYQNNTHGDNEAGPGAVPRPGIAALSAVNGLPLPWNPTREPRGQGVFALLLEPEGLWLGSDTEVIADQVRPRLALLPDQGRVVPHYEAPSEVSKIYLAGSRKAPLRSRTMQSGGFGRTVEEPDGDVPWDSLNGAFILDGRLYTASDSGEFRRRSFDGASYGPAVAVNTADQLVPLKAWRVDMRRMTAMFFDRGRVYFTKKGSSRLFYRYFAPQSDVVGVDRRTASRGIKGLDFSRVGGMTVAGGHLYWTTPRGDLKRVDWATGARSGRPVAGSVKILSGPEKDGLTWKARDLLAPDAS